jgi:glycosyltransferase involved in cell wall biosynthesis
MKPKILILVESLKVGGGSERFAATLGSKLYEEGYDISYLTLMEENPKYEFKGEYYTLKINDIYTNGIKRLADLLRYSPKIKRICEDLEVDTIISVSEVGNFYAISSRMLSGNKTRIIATQHMNPEIFMDDTLKYRSIKFLYPHADEVVCVSKATEKILNDVYDIHNTRTIYNMMDIKKNIQQSHYEFPAEYEVLFRNDSFKFINIGRLTRQKGQWFLIRSFRKVVDKEPSAKLFIIGDGPLNGDLNDLISKLQLDGHVFLLGEQENVFIFLKNSSCFVFPSLWEGFGLVLVEALSMNLPTISADCKTGPREILCPELDIDVEIEYPYYGNSGILIEKPPNELLLNDTHEVPLIKEEDDLADLMIKIIEEEELRNKYSNGLIQARNFDTEKILAQWNELLNI